MSGEDPFMLGLCIGLGVDYDPDRSGAFYTLDELVKTHTFAKEIGREEGATVAFGLIAMANVIRHRDCPHGVCVTSNSVPCYAWKPGAPYAPNYDATQAPSAAPEDKSNAGGDDA